ncbi:Partitioning defective 6-like protein gamma [Sciurus carolinensis]|uniref:Partitioning defective 6-like protein gamma n=1 Tax=Sciurus carolinensis TaxID=30640 RepID=A0AA41T268_SCICA|nr:Partitioning defective 6-like protein gamma [Sciurus carolinensis]
MSSAAVARRATLASPPTAPPATRACRPPLLQNFHPDEVESDEEADIVIKGTLEPQNVPKTQDTPSGSLFQANDSSLTHRLQQDFELCGARRRATVYPQTFQLPEG